MVAAVAFAEPRVKTAMLMNSSGVVTRHRFVRTEITWKGSNCFAFIFRCEETGAERRYGLESAPSVCA